jgi:hypothetical protein
MLTPFGHSMYRFSIFVKGRGREVDIQTGNFLYTVQSAVCSLLFYVITMDTISSFSPIVLSFMHSYIMNQNNFLQADGGLLLEPAV